MASKLPGSTIVLSVFKEELLSTSKIQYEAGRAADALGARMQANSTRSDSWTKSLGAFATQLDDLKIRLKESDGQLVSIGKSGTEATRAITDGLASALKKVKSTVEATLPSFQIGIPSTVPGTQLDLTKILYFDIPQAVRSSITGFDGRVTMPGVQIEIPAPPPVPQTFWQTMFGNTADLGAALGGSIVKAIQGGGNVFAAVAGTLGQTLTTEFAKYLTAAKELGGRAIGGFLGGAISAVLPGVGALLGPLVGKVTDVIAGAFDRNKGRDIVEGFSSTFGGFDTLQRKLRELGAEGERLWVRLTQGVGRNNPEQARAAVEAVTTAFANQGKAAQEAATKAEATSLKIIETQDAASSGLKSRISELSSEYDRLFKSIENEAPEDVMGDIESATRARMESVRREQMDTQTALDQVLQKLEESFAGISDAPRAPHKRSRMRLRTSGFRRSASPCSTTCPVYLVALRCLQWQRKASCGVPRSR